MIFGVRIDTLSLCFNPPYTPSTPSGMSCRGSYGDNRFYVFGTEVCPFKEADKIRTGFVEASGHWKWEFKGSELERNDDGDETKV